VALLGIVFSAKLMSAAVSIQEGSSSPELPGSPSTPRSSPGSRRSGSLLAAERR
jgi:hypothetical protein